MVFEIVEKSQGKHKLLPFVISIAKCSISLGRNIAETFHPDKHVEIYLDRDEGRIGLKPVDNQITGFTLTKSSSKAEFRTTLNCLKVQSVLDKGRYNAVFEDGMWVISEDNKA